MKTPLLPTQVADVEQIASSVDLPNFSEPGTGKTLTTVGAIEKMRLSGGVVFCPTVATHMWERVLSDELGAKVQRVKTGATTLDKLADFYVMSYGLVADHAPELMTMALDALVADESQYLKNSEAVRTQSIFGPDGDGLGGVYQASSQCWCLSGTPVERYADDLWSQLRATQPDTLQKYGALSLAEFQQQFCRMEWKEYGGGSVRKYVSTANQNTKLLNRMLYNETEGIGAIRRTIADVDPYMPEVKTRQVFTKAKVTPELKSLLKGKTEQQIMDMILGGGDELVRARRLMGMAKVDEVVAYIKSEATRHPVLVGFWHEDVGKELYLRLTKDKIATNMIYGATSADGRERVRQRMINGDLNVLLGQIQAMGVAMDGLQAVCSHVIFAELEWSWAKIEQFYKRLARKGQTQSTQVDFCTSLETVDTALYKVASRKFSGMQEIVG